MKKTILLFATISFLCLSSKISNAQAPDWLWAKSAVGSIYDYCYSITSDISGNIFVTGFFGSPTITFESDTLFNAGYNDIFLVKYDASGNVLWAKNAGGSGIDNSYSITKDSSGNVYVVGEFFSPTITFGSYTLNNASAPDYSDIFIVKYDTNGNVLWAKGAGGSEYDAGKSITTDVVGNVYVTGYFQSPTITFGSYTLNNSGIDDIFLVKYDENGNTLWAKNAGGIYTDHGNSITTDASGNVYVTGEFASPIITFGGDTLFNVGSDDIFLAKYDANGNILWVKDAGGSAGEQGYSINTDTSGNLYITGKFGSPTITFGSDTLYNAGSDDIFLVKYDSSGNVLWAKGVGGNSVERGSCITVDINENLYITGYFQSSTLIFDSYTLNNTGNFDIYIVKYDTSGNVHWAKSASGSSSDYSNSITADTYGNVYVAGNFYSSAITFGSFTLNNTGGSDIFVAKFGTGASINEFSNNTMITVYPNPVTDKLQIEVPQKSVLIVIDIEILNIEGQTIKTIFSNSKSATVDLTGLSSGVYIVRVKTAKEIITKKFIKE